MTREPITLFSIVTPHCVGPTLSVRGRTTTKGLTHCALSNVGLSVNSQELRMVLQFMLVEKHQKNDISCLVKMI